MPVQDITVLGKLYKRFERAWRADTNPLLLSIPMAGLPKPLLDSSYVAIDRHGNCLMKSGEIGFFA